MFIPKILIGDKGGTVDNKDGNKASLNSYAKKNGSGDLSTKPWSM